MQRYASLRQGLVGCWCPSVSGPFGYRLPDLSGYGNHGTLTNMDPGTDWVTSGGKGALDFDGSNDYVTAPYRLSAGSHTIAFWVYKKSTGVELGAIVAQRNASAARFQVWLRGDSDFNPEKVRYFNGATVYAGNGGIVSANTRWQHVAVTFQASTLRMYVDGVLDSTQSANDGTAISEGIDIGGNATGGYSKGQFDDIRIYNRALSESEIRLLASGRGVGLIPERQRNRYLLPSTRNRSSRFLSFPA